MTQESSRVVLLAILFAVIFSVSMMVVGSKTMFYHDWECMITEVEQSTCQPIRDSNGIRWYLSRMRIVVNDTYGGTGKCRDRYSCSRCDNSYSVGRMVTCHQNYWDLLVGELNTEMDPFFIGGICGAVLLIPNLVAILLWIKYGSKTVIVKGRGSTVE
jgi:hypothetical protein